jgi:hypothetical protein
MLAADQRTDCHTRPRDQRVDVSSRRSPAGRATDRRTMTSASIRPTGFPPGSHQQRLAFEIAHRARLALRDWRQFQCGVLQQFDENAAHALR